MSPPDTCANREVNDCWWRLTATDQEQRRGKYIRNDLTLSSDIGRHHRVDPVHQQDGRQVPGQEVELLQIPLGLVVVLGDPGEGQEQHGGVGALLPADSKLIVWEVERNRGLMSP